MGLSEIKGIVHPQMKFHPIFTVAARIRWAAVQTAKVTKFCRLLDHTKITVSAGSVGRKFILEGKIRCLCKTKKCNNSQKEIQTTSAKYCQNNKSHQQSSVQVAHKTKNKVRILLFFREKRSDSRNLSLFVVNNFTQQGWKPNRNSS